MCRRIGCGFEAAEAGCGFEATEFEDPDTRVV